MNTKLASRFFIVNGCRVSLVAGTKNSKPVVVLGVQLAGKGPLKDVSVDYPMKSEAAAIRFVEQANEAVAVRGKADCESKFSEFIDRVSMAFDTPRSQPFLLKDPFKDFS